MTESQYELVPGRATPVEWRRYHAFRRRRHAEWRPDEPLTPDAVAQMRMLAPDSRTIKNTWLAVRDDGIVSVLETRTTHPSSPEYETNRHLFSADAYVLREHRRRRVGRSWIPRVVEMMERHGATVMTASAEDEPGHAFLRRLGAEPKMTDRESRLDVRQVEWDMVARWVREGQAASPRSQLQLYQHRLPDEALEAFCVRLTELLNTVPFEGLDHGDMVMTADHVREFYARLEETGSSAHTCVIREPDGSISGWTDVLKHPFEPGLVRQMFTGVDRSARGRGLGKWLKAAMLEHIRRLHPDTEAIVTENAGSNAPMLAINHRLGFRLRRTVTVYQIDRQTLARST